MIDQKKLIIENIRISNKISFYKHNYTSIDKIKKQFPPEFELHKYGETVVDIPHDHTQDIYYYFDKNQNIIISNMESIRTTYLSIYSKVIFDKLNLFYDACQYIIDDELFDELEYPNTSDEYRKTNLHFNWETMKYTGTSKVIGVKQEYPITKEEFYKAFPIDIEKEPIIIHDIYSIPTNFDIDEVSTSGQSIKITHDFI